jgi:cardiolipin synthase
MNCDGRQHGDDDGPDTDPRTDDLRSDAVRWQRRLETLLGTPATTGNEIRVLRNGVEIFPAMLDAIDAAEHTVDLVTFVYWQGDIAHRFADTLSAAARRGCRVRVLLDAVGARKLDEALIERMTSSGCDVRWFRPLSDSVPEIGDLDHRTHRKILVCDAEVAFTGGVGIADEWDGDARNSTEWRDTHLQIRGPAVAGLLAGFIDNWADQSDDGFDPSAEPVVQAAADGQARAGTSACAVIRGSAETGASEVWRLMLGLITCAERRIRIATAYFNPDDRLCSALADAVARGVEVSVLLPGEHADKRFVQLAGESIYASLLDAGVDIRTYDVSMMHAKVITVDGVLATVGSANMNQRSTQFDEETNVVIFDPDVVAVLDRHLDDDHRQSTLLDPADWAERGLLQRAGEKMAGIVSGWL